MDSSETSDGHDDKVDSLSAASSPIGIPSSSHSSRTPVSGVQLSSEILRLPIIQKRDQLVSGTLTIPSVTIITSAVGESNTGALVQIQHRIYSVYGGTNGFAFDDKSSFHPGDYTLGFIFESKEIADSIIGIRITMTMETISNMMISQMIFGLYRTLGYEPSRSMKYPIVSTVEDVPFHQKTRAEMKKMSDKVTEVSTKLDGVTTKLAELLQGIISFNRPPDENPALSRELAELKKSQESLLQSIKEVKVIPEPTITLDQIREVVSASHHNIDVSSRNLDHEEKGSTEQVIKVQDIEKLISERQKYYDKLSDAEDYIEYLTSNRSHKSSGKKKH